MEEAASKLKPSNAVTEDWGGGLTELPQLNVDWVDEGKLQSEVEFAKTTLLNAMENIRENSFTTGKSVATYLDGIKKALIEGAGNAKSAWEPVFSYIEQAAVASLSTWEQKRQVLKDLEIKKVNEDWFQYLKLTEEIKTSLEKVGQATKNARIGKDMEADIKSFESVMKLVDKYYAKSEEGIKKQYDNTLAQIDNAENVAKAWAETGKLKIELERAMLKVEIERTKASLASSEQRIAQAQAESGAVSQAVLAEVEAYRALLIAQNAAVEGLDTQIKTINDRVAEVTRKIPEARKAALAEMEKTLKKNGVGSGGR